MKNIKILSFLLIAILFAACEGDYLDPTPVSTIGSNGFYKTEAEVEAAVINIYDGLQIAVQREFALTEMRSDNTRTRSSEGEWAQFERLDVKPTNSTVSNYWSQWYNVIFRCNTVIENLGAAGNSAGKFEGEAKFVRALSYFNMVRLFGDVPLVDKVISPTDKDYFVRKPKAEVYNLIISDLQTAIVNLDNTYKGRASKAAAQSLLAKVYLTIGSNYSEAKQLCEEVIASNYSLEPSFNDVFYKERNNEVIFIIEYVNDVASDSQDFSIEFTQDGRVRGLNYATTELVDAFTNFGGTPRIDSSILLDLGSTTNYRCAKFISNSTSNQQSGNDWIVIRLADVLLMHVEATMRNASETTTTNPGAIVSFQKVRDRAGLTTPVASISWQELLDERRVEFSFENQRFFDLVRFNQAETVLGTFATNNGFIFTTSDLLLPIPEREIGVSFGLLSQNPGY